MTRLFISYSRVDKKTAEELVEHLREIYDYGNVWFDSNIRAGTRWNDEIKQGIASCDVFLYLLSAESIQSKHCQNEFNAAQAQGKPVITIQIRDRIEIPEHLSEIQYVEMHQGINQKNLAKLIGAIRALTESAPPRPYIAPAVVTTPEPAPNPIKSEPTRQKTSGCLILGALLIISLVVIAGIVLPTLGKPPEGAITETQTRVASAHTATRPTTTDPETRQPTATRTPTVTRSATPTSVPTITHTPTLTRTPLPTRTQIPPTRVSFLNPLDEVYATAVAYPWSEGNNAWRVSRQYFDGVAMVLVPPGCFWMGRNQEGGYQCFEDPFWIDQLEVSQAQFDRLDGFRMLANAFPSNERPVENIHWYEANRYCKAREGRLPTESEWEYAARGPEGWLYPWGNEWVSDNTIWGSNSEAHTALVGSNRAGASWVGALDMTGNVREWTHSLHQDYPYNPDDGREAEMTGESGIRRVVRGGSWNSFFFENLSGYGRGSGTPGTRSNAGGFRCMRPQ
jgi:hypothetical protein